MPGKKPTHTGRDLHRCVGQAHDAHFNPRAPYRARPMDEAVSYFEDYISIHAPHTGRDAGSGTTIMAAEQFQSTRPIRGATLTKILDSQQMIHFNPRAPYGARPKPLSATRLPPTFQSTRPIRGATPPAISARPSARYFNPRAPYGARRSISLCALTHKHFNPRAPYGARHTAQQQKPQNAIISIHAPHTGRDSKNA